MVGRASSFVGTKAIMAMPSTIVPARDPDGQFSTFETWFSEATERIGGTNALCVDAANRPCTTYHDMTRARDESAFPVRYWFGEGNQTEGEQRQSRRMAEIVRKGLWPGILH